MTHAVNDVGAVSVKVDAAAALGSIRSIQTELVARELHDVAFALNSAMAPFNDVSPALRAWFMERADRLLKMLKGR